MLGVVKIHRFKKTELKDVSQVYKAADQKPELTHFAFFSREPMVCRNEVCFLRCLRDSVVLLPSGGLSCY